MVEYGCTIDELRDTFESLRLRSYEGIPGVARITSKHEGPTLGITICTHGNEPSGLAAARYLLEEVDLRGALLCGELYLVINNIAATERFFAATNDDEKREARFVDRNMNRLPEDLLDTRDDTQYELRRALELYPIWKQFDVGFDIHSTTQDIKPMIISGGQTFHANLTRGFPMDVLISNIDEVQIGLPAFGFYGERNAGIPVFEIEAGSHENPTSFGRAVSSVRALMQNLQMLSGSPEIATKTYQEYPIEGSIIFPDESYELVSILEDFTFLPRGTCVARGGGPDILTPFDCHVVFCSATPKPNSIAEEVMFLSGPMRILGIEAPQPFNGSPAR